ncbi:MAG: hypothetical protein IM457_15270 [Microcystis sp. M007S1]|nr:hypothetical protein [Microcystis sp. M007S1]
MILTLTSGDLSARYLGAENLAINSLYLMLDDPEAAREIKDRLCMGRE